MKYGLSVRLSERTKNMSDADKKFIMSERLEILKYCKKHGILLFSLDKIREISVVNQIKYGFKYCEDNNLKLEKVYIDLYISGGKWERKELMEMLDDFDKGKIQGFIFKDSKRFARDMILQETILNEYKEQKGADFRLIEGQDIITNEVSRKFIGVANELPIIQGKRSAERLLESKIDAKLPCIPAPYGYKYDTTKNWVIVEKKAKVVRIVAKAIKNNVKYAITCKKLKLKSPSLYYRIKSNIEKGLYHGMITFEKKVKDLKGNTIRKEKITYQGSYEPIL